jgi:hypothetical protein
MGLLNILNLYVPCAFFINMKTATGEIVFGP